MTGPIKQNQSVSIIIPVKEFNRNLEICLEHCLNLDYPDFEIIVLPDKPFVFSHPKVKVIATGNIAPPKKRDCALKEAKGEIMAFIDDDAYPDKNWLKNALRHFRDEEVGSVCGPGITAPDQPLKRIAGGEVYESILVSGDQRFRFKTLSRRNVDDYPTCNLLVRTSLMRQLGGFNTNFWPGEDTFLCTGITEKLKNNIIYEPDVVVYHQRRPLFLPHLKQIASYGLHRGYFVKKGYKSSLKISYFLPSVLFLGIVVGYTLSLLFPVFILPYFSVLAAYLFLVLIFSVSNRLELTFFKFFGIIFTHLTYGFFFILGLFSRKMREEN